MSLRPTECAARASREYRRNRIVEQGRCSGSEERKVTDYLLSGAHPDNGDKARFFHGLGFTTEDIPVFISALRDVAEIGQVVEGIESVYGVKFVVDGALLQVQTGKSAARTVRTVWTIEHGESVPRLVTAYPNEE